MIHLLIFHVDVLVLSVGIHTNSALFIEMRFIMHTIHNFCPLQFTRIIVLENLLLFIEFLVALVRISGQQRSSLIPSELQYIFSLWTASFCCIYGLGSIIMA
jgi:hypothetical protein